MTLLTFIIPVRHQDNASDWARLKANLAQTLESVSAQTNPDWRGIVVANEGADLPPLPPQFEAERVTFPPNDLHARDSSSKNDFLDAFRIDKGRRVLKGMLRARDSRFFMIVDDDDFVSHRIVQHVSEHPLENGWRIGRGLIWNDGGSLLLQHDDFNHICGTSLIVRSDLYALPDRFDDADPEFIKAKLGSHYSVAESFAETGAPLALLPFRGAVYRVGHAGSHSQTPGILRKYFLSRQQFAHPLRLLAGLAKLRVVNGAVRREFFGGRPPSATA